MITITLSKRTWLVLLLIASHYSLYRWAWNKGATAGIEYVWASIKKAEETPSKPDGEPGTFKDPPKST